MILLETVLDYVSKKIYLYLDDDQGCDSGCGLLLTLINSLSLRWLAQYGNARSLLLSLASRRPQEVYRCYTSLARRPRLLLASTLLVTHHYGPIFSQKLFETYLYRKISLSSLNLLILSLDKRS